MVQFLGRRSRGLGVVAPPSPHFFTNVVLKQLHFRTLVVKFPGEACKMLYSYLKSPDSKFCSAAPVFNGNTRGSLRQLRDSKVSVINLLNK